MVDGLSNATAIKINKYIKPLISLFRSLKRSQVPKEKSKEQAMNSNDDPPNIVSRSKKKQTGLVTIRATVSEEDMEVQDKQELGIQQDCYPTNPEDQSQVPAFVPLDMCCPSPENAVVEEAVQEVRNCSLLQFLVSIM